MKTKNLILTTALAIASVSLSAQGAYKWVKTNGNKNNCKVKAITTDSKGNSINVGVFADTVDFKPGKGVKKLISKGKLDVYIQKLTPQGTLAWAVSFGSKKFDEPESVTTDKAGNVYVTSSFSDTITFNGGKTVIAAQGWNKFFMAKYTAAGKFAWAKIISCENGASGNAITSDKAGHIYVVGSFRGTMDFDPNEGKTELTAESTSPYLLKLKEDGSFVWAKSFQSKSYGKAMSVSTNGTQVAIGGYFTKGISLDPNAPDKVTNGKKSSRDGFWAILDKDGNYVKGNTIGSLKNEQVNAVALSKKGNLYMTGFYNRKIGLEGVDSLKSFGKNELFVAKVNPQGKYSWAKSFGAKRIDVGTSISINKNEDVLVGGYFEGKPQFAGKQFISKGGLEGVLLKFNTNGKLLWGHTVGGNGYDRVLGVSFDLYGNVYAGGAFEKTVDFNPGKAAKNVKSKGYNDGYVLKLSK